MGRLSEWIWENNDMVQEPKGYGGEPTHKSLKFGIYIGVPICQINDAIYLESLIENIYLGKETEELLSNRCAEIYINNIKNEIHPANNYIDSPF